MSALTPSMPASYRTFVAYVEDRPGVLNRIASLFRRRGYNIISLNVGRTHENGVSRMTFTVNADDDTASRIEANLYKLVNVLSVEDITRKASVVRDLALIKLTVGPEKRAEVLQLCEVFRARPVDVGPNTLIVEITGDQDKIEGLLTILAPFGITEMVQTGAIAMTRGPLGEAAAVAHQPTPPTNGAAVRGIATA
jgi:acetolactate synthase I/III small subunit